MIRVIILLLFLISISNADVLIQRLAGQLITKSETKLKENNQTIKAIKNDEFSSFEDEFEPQKKRFDPLNGYNRAMTTFNDYTYLYFFDPIARGYKYVVPDEIRYSVLNFFDNLAAPMRFLNNLLQGKFKNSGEELFRFTLNTILGVGGLGDPAKVIFGIERHPEDFGQTLGYYGVGAGFPIVWPFFGPSNVRDSIGFVGDYYTDPTSYIQNQLTALGISAYGRVNYMSFHLKEYKVIRKDAIDLYPFLQDFYEKRRESLISQ